MELWTVKMTNYKENKEKTSSYKTQGEAVESVTSFAMPLLDAGFEQAVKKDGTVVELSNGDERYEFTIFRTSSFEQAPDVVVNSYIYGDRYILEVMHDFKANTATLYVYDRESPDMKIAISHYDLKDGSISDSEIMAAAAPDLDDSLAALALLMSV